MTDWEAVAASRLEKLQQVEEELRLAREQLRAHFSSLVDLKSKNKELTTLLQLHVRQRGTMAPTHVHIKTYIHTYVPSYYKGIEKEEDDIG